MTFDKFYIEEGIIKGKGTDDVGEFEIDGTCEAGNIRFDKQYIEQHLVVYTGKYDGQTLEGKW